jgi:hypothetical protein
MDGTVVLPAQPGAEADGQRHGAVMVKFDMPQSARNAHVLFHVPPAGTATPGLSLEDARNFFVRSDS